MEAKVFISLKDEFKDMAKLADDFKTIIYCCKS